MTGRGFRDVVSWSLAQSQWNKMSAFASSFKNHPCLRFLVSSFSDPNPATVTQHLIQDVTSLNHTFLSLIVEPSTFYFITLPL